jgi:DNA-binding Lrp family transcriptional regulator
MDSPYSPLEFSMLNDWQRNFPIAARPFARIGEKVGAGETAVLAALEHLQARGAISRVGAVLAPRRIGASTLAALAAPAAQMQRIADLVSARPEVNHNYQREHHYNLWFVATAADQEALERTLRAIEVDTGCAIIALPLEQEYHIDLGFDLTSPHKHRSPLPGTPARAMDAVERQLIAALAAGTGTGSAALCTPRRTHRHGRGRGAGADCRLAGRGPDQALRRRRAPPRTRLPRQRHGGVRPALYRGRPDRPQRLAAEPGVTLCYRRTRSLPDWPYNLYCMVHGRSREEAQPVIDRLVDIVGVPATALFSTRRFKQCGARYFAEAAVPAGQSSKPSDA